MTPFSLLVLGDTQYLCDGDRRRPELLLETFAHVQRLVDAGAVAEVRHVVHVGDATEHGWQAEAGCAVDSLREGLATIGGPALTMATGNHDVAHHSDDTRGTTAFLEAFGPGCGLLSGAHASGVAHGPGGYSSWRTVALPDAAALGVLALDWRPSAAGWEWADDMLAAHPDLPTVVVSHESGCAGAPTPHGAVIDAMLAKHPQVFLVLSGHMWPSTRVRTAAREYHVINYQELPFGGAGAARLYEFDPRSGTCQVISICPALQRPEVLRSVTARRLLAMNRPEDQFSFPLPRALGGRAGSDTPWQADRLSLLAEVVPTPARAGSEPQDDVVAPNPIQPEPIEFELALPGEFVLELDVTLPRERLPWQVLLSRLLPAPETPGAEPLAAVTLSSENFLGWQAVTESGETWATSHEYGPGSRVTVVFSNGSVPGVWVDGDAVGRTDANLGAVLAPGPWRWRLGSGDDAGNAVEHFRGTIHRFRAWA